MKNLRQTTLSFASVPKTGESSRLAQQPPPTPTQSTSKSSKPKKSRKTATSSGPARAITSDVVEIPPPIKRSIRPRGVTGSSRASSSKVSSLSQSRKMSYKRKLSLSPESEDDAPMDLPSITVDSASSPCLNASASVRGGRTSHLHPLLPKDSNLSSSNQPNSSCPPAKKPRFESPLSALTPLPSSSDGDTDVDEFGTVPTSQSDEQELSFPTTLQTHASVDKWRKETLPGYSSRTQTPITPNSDSPYSPCAALSELPMDVDERPLPASSAPETPVLENSSISLPYPQTPCSTSEASSQPHEIHSLDAAHSSPIPATQISQNHTPIPLTLSRMPSHIEGSPSDAFRSLTPPPSSDFDMNCDDSPAVKPLDVQSKTKQLIADIKARALAAARSSPEQTPLDLDGLSDLDSDSSSSEDETDVRKSLVAELVNATGHKGKTPSAPRPSSPGPSYSTSRYNLRRGSPSTVTRAPPKSLTQHPKPAKKFDPLSALLQEKRREERTGTGMAAIRAADEMLAQSKIGLQQEMTFEEDGSDSDVERGVSTHLFRTKGKGKGKSKSPILRTTRARYKTTVSVGEESDDEDTIVAQMNAKAFLGEKGGDAVGKILEKDMEEKKAMALAKKNAAPLGVPLWTVRRKGDSRAYMDTEFTVPSFTAQINGSPLLQALKDSADRNSSTEVHALLSAGVLTDLDSTEFTSIVSWLFDIAFSNAPSDLSRLAYMKLLMRAPTSGYRLSSILSAMLRLGASPEVLKEHGFVSPLATPMSMCSDVDWRSEMAIRLMSFVEAGAPSSCSEELSDCVLAMALIGMDPTTSDEMQSWVRKACDSLARVMSTAQEAAAYHRLVTFGRALSPLNQSRLVSLIPPTSSPATRIARCIARSFLLDMAVDTERPEDLPDLTPFVDLLSPPAGSGAPFDVMGNSDKDGFYEALTCRISILGRALSDIDEYTILEWKTTHAARKGVDHADEEDGAEHEKDREKMSVLEQIKRQLDMLHGRIVDTRAAHLDRSRAKAAIQRLAFRIHYQRVATLKSGLIHPSRPQNLFGYFNGSA